MTMKRTALTLTIATLAATASAEAQTWRTMQSARQLQGDGPVAVHVEYGAGRLGISSADSPMLYAMDMRFDEDQFRPVTEWNAERRELRLGVDGRSSRNVNVKSGSTADIRLTPSTPITLDLDFGAGEAEIDLGGMTITGLDVSTGASQSKIRFGSPNRTTADHVSIQAGAAELEVIGLGNARARNIEFEGGVGSTTLDFTGEWAVNTEATIEMGIGEVTIRVPRGLGVRLTKSSFLTSFDTEGLTKRGNAFFSPDWDSARHRLSLDVSAAFGAVRIVWVDG